jgi:anthranilate synthase component II
VTVVVVDNYDSFTYNLAQYVAMLGWRPVVVTNDTPLDQVRRLEPAGVIVSPGPGTADDPADCGTCYQILGHFIGSVPVLGVCLGHQMVAKLHGARIRPCTVVRHGRISTVRRLRRSAVLHRLPETFPAMRYHSMAVDAPSLPAELSATAESADDGELMALEHREHLVFGVQFHPESVGTPGGLRVLRNFLDLTPAGTPQLRRDDVQRIHL